MTPPNLPRPIVNGSGVDGVCYVMIPKITGTLNGAYEWSVTWSVIGPQTVIVTPETVTLNGREYYRFSVDVSSGGLLSSTHLFSVSLEDQDLKKTSPQSDPMIPSRGWQYQPDGSAVIPAKIPPMKLSPRDTPIVQWSAVPNAEHYDVQWGETAQTLIGPSNWGVYQNAVHGTSLEATWFSSDLTKFTHFRVYAVNSVLGRAVPGPLDGMLLKNRDPKPGVVVGPAAAGSAAGSAAASATGTVVRIDTVVAKDGVFEVNLPMVKYGVGTGAAAGGGSLPSNYASGMPGYADKLWRHGMLVMNGQAPAAEAPPDEVSGKSKYRRYGFVFHYNPASWTQTAAMALDVDLSNLAQTSVNGAFLPLPTSYATISLTIYLNRILEVALGEKLRAGSSLSDMFRSDVLDAEGTSGMSSLFTGSRGNMNGSPAGREAVSLNFAKKLNAVTKKGTLADMEYLYRTLAGTPFRATHVHPDDPYQWTSDIGLIPMQLVDLHLGENLRFNGRVTGISVQHLLFSHRMVPTWTEVTLQLTRGLTLETTADYSTEAGYSMGGSNTTYTPAP